LKKTLLIKRLDKSLQVIRSARLMWVLICNRVCAGTEHRWVLKKHILTVVDIGANRGQFTLAARRWAQKARVIAFEPLAEAASRFRKVFRGDTKVTLHQAAIGPVGGETSIHVTSSDDSSSLLPISSLQKRIFPGTLVIRTEMVKVGQLSEFVASKEIISPAMLKLDVQGYELEALRGCEQLLERFSYVYAECSFLELYTGQAMADDIIEYLRKRGWCISGIYNMMYDWNGKSVQADFLFENSSYGKH